MTNEMTAEEAVKQIKGNCYFASISEKTKQALDKAIKALEAQPCEDCISRQAVIDHINLYPKIIGNRSDLALEIKHLPPVTPTYTDEEIDKAQAVEQAYVDKMVELAVEETRREWLNSFDTSSATKCFEAVNLLKQRLEGEE